MSPGACARIGALFAVAFAARLFSPAPTQAQDTTTYLQMANMTALAATADGRRSNIPVTTFIQVGSTAAASEICRRVPVIRSAVLEATTQRPIPYARGVLDSDAVSDFVVSRINGAMGTKTVFRIGFIHGTPKDAPASATDLAEAGDMMKSDRAVKASPMGQMAPCRRIVAPPASFKWVDAASAPKTPQTLAPPTPSLRENRAPAPPAPEFKSHPQFAPTAPPKPRSEVAPPTRPPLAIVGTPEQIQVDMPPSARDCIPLDKLWKPARYPYAGTLYTLSRIFTIDANGDGRTDNIGFTLSAPGQADLIFRYFDEPGRAAIDSFPSLELDDPRTIARTCFGQFSPMASETAAGLPKDRFAIDILRPSDPSAPVMQATGAGFWVSFLVAAAGLLGVAFALIVFMRRRRTRAGRAASDEDKPGDERRAAERRGVERRGKSTPVENDRRATPDRRGGERRKK